jgi:hypothetical protein
MTAAGRVTSAVVGFRVVGRHGPLGVVVALERSAAEPVLIVRGGASDALRYCVPSRMVRSRSAKRRLLVVEADVTDFVPHLRDDGAVDLLPIGGSDGDR